MSILNFCEIADNVINELGKQVDFLYAYDIIPGGKIDLELKKDGVLLYAKVWFWENTNNKSTLHQY